MTNEQILKKSIEKAVKNGWKAGEGWLLKEDGLDDIIENDAWAYVAITRMIIFNHQFAKAFWGDIELQSQYNLSKKVGNYSLRRPLFIKEWQYHLQQMVLEEDPIKYLEKFICKKNNH